MKRVFFWIFLGQMWALALTCAGQEKVSVPDLLDLTTRERALQDFVLRADPSSRISGWYAREKFAADHRDIDVLACFDRQAKKLRYAVTWKTRSRVKAIFPETELPKKDVEMLASVPQPAGMIFPSDLGISVFEKDGTLIELSGASHSDITGYVRDLADDGAMEIMSEGGFGKARYVMVQPLTGPQPVFAVAYEWSGSRELHKEWGYAIRKSDSGCYDILFGPREKDAINPEVIFRYDGRLGTWVCDDAGEHLRVLEVKNVWAEIVKLGEESEP